ncbi:MAG: flavodoxin family protein [Pseudobdellovibrionaceae bacterium]
MKQKRLLILNGSIQGAKGNCGLLIEKLKKNYSSFFQISVSHLKTESASLTTKKLLKADCLFFVTGTYWESWGSPLQKFFEDFTELEATEVFLGKPAGFVVLCHSVGGKSVLSRMQANINLFGCLLPPFCGMELSLVSQELLKLDPNNRHQKDLWQIDDLEIILHNLQAAAQGQAHYLAWPVDKKHFRKKWIQ